MTGAFAYPGLTPVSQLSDAAKCGVSSSECVELLRLSDVEFVRIESATAKVAKLAALASAAANGHAPG